ncbi:MAG TPA: DNA-formamidopyrimidine glycosylase family protein [Kineosporiaceae bacterium]
MPEGHTIHRLARQHLTIFGARPVRVSSPQGRFEAGAALLDGQLLLGGQAHGKHEFLHFEGDRWLHVHLGLGGSWVFGEGDPPPPRGSVRVRLAGDAGWADLRGPTVCAVLAGGQVAAVRARLGADPLRRDADPAAAGDRIQRSRLPLGALLMQQDIVAGVGNVFRAESLFRAGLDPWRPGRELDGDRWAALWADLVALLRDGVRRGRIVTTRREHRSRRGGALLAEDAHYVYRRTGLGCRVCGAPVVAEPMAGRTLYRCVTCQRG